MLLLGGGVGMVAAEELCTRVLLVVVLELGSKLFLCLTMSVTCRSSLRMLVRERENVQPITQERGQA